MQYESLFDESSGEPQTEWVPPLKLRPAPPSTALVVADLTNGQGIEMKHDDGWWQVEMAGGDTRGNVLVKSQWGTHQVSAELLRPGWVWDRVTGAWSQR